MQRGSSRIVADGQSFVLCAGTLQGHLPLASGTTESDMKPVVLSLVLVTLFGALAAGCVSYSRTEREVPAPAPAPVVHRTVYPDGSYVDRPVQPAR